MERILLIKVALLFRRWKFLCLLLHRLLFPIKARLGTPPPILRSSILPSPSHLPSIPDISHSMAVDRLSTALDGDPSEDGNSQEEDVSDDSNNDISEGEGPDDSMTLVQY